MTTQEVVPSAVARIGTLTPFQLAHLAGCGSPDGVDSAGARMLTRVVCDLQEAVLWEAGDDGDLTEAVAALDYGGGLHQIADGAVPVYTSDLWETFSDLSGYLEDPHELGCDHDRGMNGMAGVCLYLIADRLVRAGDARLDIPQSGRAGLWHRLCPWR